MTPPSPGDTVLDRACHWEQTTPNRSYLTQPMGAGVVVAYTWKQVMGQARRVAAHLLELELPAGSHVAIIGKNSAHWIMADLAIALAGHVSVPIYPTLPADALAYVLDHGDIRLAFVGKIDGWEALACGIPDNLPLIGLPLGPAGDAPRWDDLVAAHEPLAEAPRRAGDELATIVYTSGSTGRPKGVMLSFGAMAEAALGLGRVCDFTPHDRMLSYLPLAHVYERWIVEAGSLMWGYEVFFAERLDTFLADLARARPTLFISVPRLWQKFHQGVSARLPPELLRWVLRVPMVSRVMRRALLRSLGLDQVRFAGSGSAPIAPALLQWYRDLGLELLEGYGMSENFAYSHICMPGRTRVGYVGEPYPGVAQRISEEGEVQVKSPAMMLGYYKAPDLSAEAFTEDGFLRTGDRGELDDEGRLRITGRLKELFKTSKGKYVAPAPIENQLVSLPGVEAACVSGSGMSQPYALACLSDAARAKADASAAARARMGDELALRLDALNAELEPHERLAALVIVNEPWTIEAGLLTPTMKIRRDRIEARYGVRAGAWVAAPEMVVWV